MIVMVLNIAHFRKQIIYNWRALNCGAGGGRRSSFCSVVWEMKKNCNVIGHTFFGNCLTKHDISWKTYGSLKVRERRRRRHKHLQDDLKESRGYWKLNEKTLDSVVSKKRFGRC